MELSAALTAQLRALSVGLDPADDDLESMFARFTDTCRRAVPSCLGFSITVVSDEVPVTFTQLDDHLDRAAHVTSATLPLAVLDPAGAYAAGSEITLYAATPGAFVDLAADIDHALELGAGVVRLDGVRTLPSDDRTADDLLRARNQAIGILLERGDDADPALADVEQNAEDGQLRPHAAARQVIDSAVRRPDRPGQ